MISCLILAMLLGSPVLSQEATKKSGDFQREIARAPVRERQSLNPYEGQTQALDAGKKLYRQHCAQCHGENGSGGDRAPTLRSREIREATAGELAWFLKNGILLAGMPSWSKLPPQRRWQLVAYLKSLT
ncbi:MAG: c-type cytochrome [Candidatus Acidiferrales bacterium]